MSKTSRHPLCTPPCPHGTNLWARSWQSSCRGRSPCAQHPAGAKPFLARVSGGWGDLSVGRSSPPVPRCPPLAVPRVSSSPRQRRWPTRCGSTARWPKSRSAPPDHPCAPPPSARRRQLLGPGRSSAPRGTATPLPASRSAPSLSALLALRFLGREVGVAQASEAARPLHHRCGLH